MYVYTEERMLVELKQEMPGLKLSQYKVRVTPNQTPRSMYSMSSSRTG